MRIPALALLLSVVAVQADAQERGGMFDWVHGDWYLTLGAAAFMQPRYEGSDSYIFSGIPLISLGKAGNESRFTSRNDNASISFFDAGSFRIGATGKLLFERDESTSDDLIGLSRVPFGGELGVFAEVYPTDWLRVRGEVRQGIESHDGIVADFAADVFHDVNDRVRLSAGPRVSFATAAFFDAYYGVTPEESVLSGLSVYEPGGGINWAGVGGAVTWKTTDRVTTSLFGEYARLLGAAADSSLVEERGSDDQFLFGVSATYRFDFRL